jgi:hypothetical protein
VLPPEAVMRTELHLQIRERDQLERSGRPSYYIRRKVLGFAAIAAGAASVGVATLAGVMFGGVGPHSGSNRLNHRQVAVVWGAIGAGLATAGVGIWAVTSAQHDNVYRERILQLDETIGMLKRQFKEARRAHKRSARYGLSPELSLGSGQRALLRFSVAF